MKEDVKEKDASLKTPDVSTDAETPEPENMQDKINKITEGKTPKKRFRIVEPKTSKYPVLNAELLGRKGKKIFVAEGIIDDEPFKIGIRRGVPIETQLMLKVTADVFALRGKKSADDTEGGEPPKRDPSTWHSLGETNREIYAITVASMMVLIDEDDAPITDPDTGQFVPLFSRNGVGGEVPIEEMSDLVLSDLYNMVQEVQAPSAAADMLNEFQNPS